MTSKQIMLILSAVWLVGMACALPGCHQPERVPTTKSPYDTRRVFAVAPLRNESGSAYADGTKLADKLTYQLALTRGLDTLPVNRVLAAMDALNMPAISSPQDAMRLRQTLGVDGLVVGSITAYDPYSPMKLGMNLELYLADRGGQSAEVDPRQLSRAATDGRAVLPGSDNVESSASRGAVRGQPVTAMAGFYDAGDPNTVDLLEAYTVERLPDGTGEMTLRRHTISMDLFSEFVGYQLTERLMENERLRLKAPGAGRTSSAARPPFPESANAANASPTSQAYGHSPLRFEP